MDRLGSVGHFRFLELNCKMNFTSLLRHFGCNDLMNSFNSFIWLQVKPCTYLRIFSKRNRLMEMNWFNSVKWPTWRVCVRPPCAVLVLCVESRLHAGQCVEQPVGFPALPGQEPFPLQLHRQPSRQHSTQHERGDFIPFILLLCHRKWLSLFFPFASVSFFCQYPIWQFYVMHLHKPLQSKVDTLCYRICHFKMLMINYQTCLVTFWVIYKK